MSWSSIPYIILSALIIVLVSVTQCQRAENVALRAEVEKAEEHTAQLQSQLDETIAQRDADRKRILDAAKRMDEALTLFVTNTEEAHDDHEERMETLSSLDNPETVDWLCEPVPDDIRQLFGCDATDGNRPGGQTDATGSADAAMQ